PRAVEGSALRERTWMTLSSKPCKLRAPRRYKFLYGDFAEVHRCGLLAAESRAGQYKHTDIEKAAHELHDMIDARRRERASR
ncbi:MAG: hypothetical protein K0S65_6534, partial [Labilithrix sp.]|nr:hypothetical protein [Labilithrix sp.]